MVKAIRIEQNGGPEVMRYVDVDLAAPGEGQVQVRHRAIGLNFIDCYFRSGLYPAPLPSGLGMEGSGVIEAVGYGVKGFKVGERVAYAGQPLGAYSEARNMPTNNLVKLPKSVSDETAAGMMLKGMTVRYLIRATYKVKRGETILLHAAAGGVGLILSQWAKALGAKVIGVVGSHEKMVVAKAHGCTHVINSASENVVARVREITGGKGVPVVYDGVGQATLMTSLDCLAPRGLLVSFGNASGPISALNLGLLAARGSLYVTRPTLGSYISTPAEFKETAQDLMEIVKSGKVKIAVNQRYALADAAKAHRDLEARKTTGASVLLV